MDNLEKILDHAVAAEKRLYDQFRCTEFGQYIQARAARFQDLEDIGCSLIEDRYLANATGQTLTYIGELVGIERPTSGLLATDDDLFRPLVFAQIFVNVSEGRAPDIYNILAALGATSPRVFDVYPAAATVNFGYSPTITDCDCIRDILEQATPPVALDITAHSATPFGFAGDSTAFGFGVGELGTAV